MSDYPPEVAVQRAMLMQNRETLRAEGFAAYMTAEMLVVQEGDGRRKGQMVADALETMNNSYAAARRMDELLAALPEPE